MARATVHPTASEKVAGLAAKGLTQSEAARKLGVSRQRVSQLAAQLGLAFRRGAPPISEKRLKELAKKGLTKKETARRLGVSRERVSDLGARLHISFAPVWSRPKAAATELGRIIQTARLACGYSYARLGALSGLNRGHITAIERGWVRCPIEKTLRALANCLASHTSYEELLGALPQDQAVPEERLKELARKGLTRTEAARELGVSLDRVSKLAAKLDLSFAPFLRTPQAPATEFGRILQTARLASGYSYSRLAALSGLDRHHVIYLVLGRIRHPTVKTLRALADSLDGSALYEKLVRAANQAPPPARRGGRPAGRFPKRGRAKST